MVGIKSYGAYIPRCFLGKETAGWGLAAEKAVCNFDEDSVTMAVAAGTFSLDGELPINTDGGLKCFGATPSGPAASA